ncbi:hypothetical protein A8924_1826 [Saccharopolyspora erythraea NRRL 2338]|uniref:Glyoxalase/bleomycin resistance protein/dioxygenase n=2 Tax=Saccharopolyspora erythraea TaxID=1836 RepID=A4F9M6_SACEN|nr:VOC family protein [Saccharopolyspora erythraea]EQD87384.1 glyoxalase [Saccharopolyspora erythraea D]PFG94538.1 hypothetical protein A8924_1826 [Saccharopolyspora erythraea NRRL 2338]QRK91286.1 VOC family protein [Saccharopolyspora erythraea]CAM00751.1 glyoxalase/bleomycin resistance protein/dioxygenase [Saccharopolyspora erythraea NRRL 2338]
MKPKTTIVSLPVADLDRSLRFYRDGLGLRTDGIDEGIILFELPNLSLFLIGRDEFAKYAGRADVAPHDPSAAAGCIITCAIGSQQEVDDTLARAAAAGGSAPQPAGDYDGSYTGYFTDPDGHVWELVFNARTEAAPSPA